MTKSPTPEPEQPLPTSLAMRDVQSVAEYFVYLYGNLLRYDEEERCWREYNGKYWAQVPDSRFVLYRSWCLDSIIMDIPENIWDFATKGKIIRACRNYTTAQQLAKHVQELTATHFDAKDVFAVDNGVINADGRLVPHQWTDFNTWAIPTKYDPSYVDKTYDDPPEFITFFRNISHNPSINAPDANWCESMLDLLGYIIIRGNPEQIFAVWFGNGRNGKDTMYNWFVATFGTGFIQQAPIEEISAMGDPRTTVLLSALGHARVVSFLEIEDVLLHEGRIKAITGGKEFTGRAYNVGPKTVPVVATPLLIGNDIPKLKTGGHAIARREITVPFQWRIPEPRGNYEKELITEEARMWLLAQVIERMQRYQREQKINFCARWMDYTQAMLEEQDDIPPFIDECLVYEDGARTPAREIALEYVRWRDADIKWVTEMQTGYPAKATALSNYELNAFYHRLRAHNIQVKQGRIDKKIVKRVVFNFKLKR